MEDDICISPYLICRVPEGSFDLKTVDGDYYICIMNRVLSVPSNMLAVRYQDIFKYT